MRISSNQILLISKEEFVNSLVEELCQSEIEKAQIIAWEATFDIIRELSKNKHLKDVEFIFEYEIPLSDGMRTDILMFVQKKLYLIEFKNRGSFSLKDINQLSNYEKLFKYYHSESHSYEITPILLLNADDYLFNTERATLIMSKTTFIEKWNTINKKVSSKKSKVFQFQKGVFKPNLDIVKYAESIFLDNYLKGVENPILEESKKALDQLNKIAKDSKEKHRHSIIFILGEAGSGKTALALKVSKLYNGCFISKNGKLISLLQERLNHRVNLHSSTSIIREYFSKRKLNTSNIYLIDEAQRTWDKKRIEQYYGKPISEHQILLNHISQNKKWSTTVIFIGIGQQLATNETSYFEKWIEALDNLRIDKKKVRIYQPYELELGKHNIQTRKLSEFYLHNSIRNNVGGKYSKLINDILEEPSANHIQKSVQYYNKQGLQLFISKDLDSCIDYLNFLKVKSTAFLGTQALGDSDFEGEIINYENAKKVNLNNTLKLNKAINKDHLIENSLTQFQALGLEFDLPIIQWNYDYLYYKSKWNYDFERRIIGFGMFYIRNAYRVLLTRGRKGMILYFPKNWEYNKTYDYFKSIGFIELNNKLATTRPKLD